jgi:hypothetical protein
MPLISEGRAGKQKQQRGLNSKTFGSGAAGGGASYLIRDTWTRTATDSWGTADVGGAWTITDTGANFDVAGGVGTLVISSQNSDLDARLGSTTYLNAEHQLKFKSDKLATGAAQKLKIRFRRTDATNYYYAFVIINTTGTIQIQCRKIVAGVDTALGTTTTVAGVTHSAGQYYNLNFRVRDIVPSSTLEKGVSWLNWHTWGFPPTVDWVGMAADADDLVAANCNWVRTRVGENDSFASIDQFVAILAARNLKWNCTIRKSFPDDDLGTTLQRNNFKTWLTSFVNRYDQYVDLYEIGNEPNLPEFWTIDYTNDVTLLAGVTNYCLHLQDAYETIKAINPSAIVAQGGFSSGDISSNGTSGTFGRFIDQFVIANGPDYLDYTAFHPYASSAANNVVAANALITKMAQDAAWAAKPIWFNEIGYSTHSGAGGPEVASEAIKATRLTDLHNALRNVSGARLPIFWYTLHDDNVGDNGFGLIRRNTSTYAATYLDAYDAFQDLFEGATPEAEISIKLWQDGSAEPEAYPYTVFDSSLMSAGSFAIEARLDASTSNAPVVFTFEDVEVTAI